MKLYVTYTSPFARLARILVLEKGLGDRVEIIEAKTRTPGSPQADVCAYRANSNSTGSWTLNYVNPADYPQKVACPDRHRQTVGCRWRGGDRRADRPSKSS